MVSTPGLVGILTGPTAAGKTALALELARPGIEIVNADSLLFYRGMDIGTAKPTVDERARVPHHLIDFREPQSAVTAGDFARIAREKIGQIEGRGGRALVVGGSGFYLKALLYGMWDAPGTDAGVRARLETRANAELYARLEARDAEAALRIGANDRYRLIRSLEMIELGGKSPSELAAVPRAIDPRFQLWVIDREPAELNARIEARTEAMLAAGFVDEGRALLARYPTDRPRALQAVGYAQLVDHLENRAPEGRKLRPGLAGLRDEIALATRQLVKRQRTWFRGEAASRWFELERDREKLREEWAVLSGTPGGCPG
jgi:tRNA dimethylallyltransferase